MGFVLRVDSLSSAWAAEAPTKNRQDKEHQTRNHFMRAVEF
jgi:hypothetical protein